MPPAIEGDWGQLSSQFQDELNAAKRHHRPSSVPFRQIGIGGGSDFFQEYMVPVRSACEELRLDMDVTLIPDSLSLGCWTSSRELAEFVESMN